MPDQSLKIAGLPAWGTLHIGNESYVARLDVGEDWEGSARIPIDDEGPSPREVVAAISEQVGRNWRSDFTDGDIWAGTVRMVYPASPAVHEPSTVVVELGAIRWMTQNAELVSPPASR